MAQVTNQQHSEAIKLGLGGSTWQERWQSLKAGGLGAIAAMLTVAILLLINFVTARTIPELVGVWADQDGARGWMSGAIAAFSGFLFAVTYRYIIRQDQNPHLRSGAVGAFGLVRGLALVEMSWQHASPWVLMVFVIESFLLFGGIRVVLDQALAQGWLLPFNGSQEQAAGLPNSD